ncbi:MAG TPA: HAD-IIIC family phosphatase [Candidatus Acidoferrales bacterium]|nr:HAD-IIIC family phosphatase [Candidatus Acidoferrales bacterium]
MNLIDALETLKNPVKEDAASFSVHLACGFTPLHIETFLCAQLRKLLPLRDIDVSMGIYGDFQGNLERAASTKCHAGAVIIEWQDLDSRLGIRNLGGWREKDLGDIVRCAGRKLETMEQTLRIVAEAAPTALCFPTLPLPPLFFTTRTQASELELELRKMVADAQRRLAALPNVHVVSSQAIDEKSPIADRMDVQSEILAGFPYKVKHASIIAESLAALIQPRSPKKGLITDLDDTLWSGLVGEVGSAAVSWHLEEGSHIHGLFQQFLASLASSGALIGIASKNDPQTVESALDRKDLLLAKENVFPVAVSWAPKSESVREILKVWNVGVDSVVFVDDSPLEVAEVKSAFPEMECIVFPRSDYQAFWRLLQTLRDMFGKPHTSEEDALRSQSIRHAGEFRERLAHANGDSEKFLANVDASITFALQKTVNDRRAFELINKTNQFNLNGKRLTESDWLSRMNDPATVFVGVNYQDKFGALGKIAVLLGRKEGRAFTVDCWVMSCRAFSRRIECACLMFLFEYLNVDSVALNYKRTTRNGYLQEFLTKLLETDAAEGCVITREEFQKRCPHLSHQVIIDE